MNIIGIDPGKNGAIVILSERGEILEKRVMPLIANTDLDTRILQEIFLTYPSSIAFMESVHAIFGSSAKATFSFGYICGSIHAILSCSQIPFVKVPPKTWQKVIFQGIPEIKKPAQNGQKSKIDTKAMSALAAKRLFPTADLRKTNQCKRSHDGIIDALLIAEYGRRVSAFRG